MRLRYARSRDGDHPHDRAEDRDPRPAVAGDPGAPPHERGGARSRSRSRSPPPRRAGATLTDVDGNTFVDFAGGVGCLNVGHSHPHVVQAAQEQLDRFSHTDFTVVPYEVYATLSERLLALAPLGGPAKAAFFNAGTEAVENAVKFARAYTGRSAVIGFEGAFHGRTYLSLALTSKTRPYKEGLGPFAPEVYRVPFNDVDAIRRAFKTLVAPEDVAAIVFEPVQGEGGFIPATQEFIEGVRAICDEHGIVMVCDEVQSGFARTGRFFAIEHFGVDARPDHGREVDRDGDPALGRPRQGGDHGRARRRAASAARTSATRSPRRRRSPCST